MKRRLVLGGVALCSAAALVLSACGDKSTKDGDSASPSGLTIAPVAQIDIDGKEVPADSTAKPVLPSELGTAPCEPISLGWVGAQQGDDAQLGINVRNGAQLAIDEHNKANPNCKITLKPFDTEGDPQKASQVVPAVINDPSIVAVIGPGFSGETKATGDKFAQAGLLAATASATNPGLSKNGWKTFVRGLANDAVQGPAVAKYLANTLKYKKVCVIKDDSDYGVGLAKTITEGLGAAHDPSCDADVKKKERDFAAVVSKVSQAKPDAVFYSGYYSEAAPLAQQLKNGGVDVPFISGDGANDPKFVEQAGAAAKGAVLSCPCGPAKDPFKSNYKNAFNIDPGVYSIEGYDLATIMMKGISEGKKTRAALLDYVKKYNGTGVARQYQWTPEGELTSSLTWIYKVQ